MNAITALFARLFSTDLTTYLPTPDNLVSARTVELDEALFRSPFEHVIVPKTCSVAFDAKHLANELAEFYNHLRQNAFLVKVHAYDEENEQVILTNGYQINRCMVKRIVEHHS